MRTQEVSLVMTTMAHLRKTSVSPTYRNVHLPTMMRHLAPRRCLTAAVHGSEEVLLLLLILLLGLELLLLLLLGCHLLLCLLLASTACVAGTSGLSILVLDSLEL